MITDFDDLRWFKLDDPDNINIYAVIARDADGVEYAVALDFDHAIPNRFFSVKVVAIRDGQATHPPMPVGQYMSNAIPLKVSPEAIASTLDATKAAVLSAIRHVADRLEADETRRRKDAKNDIKILLQHFDVGVSRSKRHSSKPSGAFAVNTGFPL